MSVIPRALFGWMRQCSDVCLLAYQFSWVQFPACRDRAAFLNKFVWRQSWMEMYVWVMRCDFIITRGTWTGGFSPFCWGEEERIRNVWISSKNNCSFKTKFEKQCRSGLFETYFIIHLCFLEFFLPFKGLNWLLHSAQMTVLSLSISCHLQMMCFLSVAQSDMPIMSCCKGLYPNWISWRDSLLALSGSHAEMLPLFPSFLSASNPCEKNDGRGPCSHLCLINYNRTASCTCPHLMKLSPNKQSCFGKTGVYGVSCLLCVHTM